MQPITRRHFLVETLAAAALPAAFGALDPGEERIDFTDTAEFKVERKPENPRVKCFDLKQLDGPLTPTTDFFEFHQTTVPAIDPRRWRLEVGGCVQRPGTFTLEALAASIPRDEFECIIECSGNLPRPEIMNGQISNARWAGFKLGPLLQKCGVKPEAREAVFFGADQVRDATGAAFGPHARSVFIQDVVESDALLATHMNGLPLVPAHGFPLRLILPGWYGVAHIKWLSRIEIIDRRYEGPHMSQNYHTLHVVTGQDPEPLVMETSISRTRLKSVVARVTRRRAGTGWVYRVSGAAWGGASRVERVELRVDQGPWRTVQLDEQRGKHSWGLWSCEWHDATPGRHTLTSRAINAVGEVQPTPEEWRLGIRSARENNAQWERPIEIPG